MVRQFHKLSRELYFDLFGLIDLEILQFKVGCSAEISRFAKIKIKQEKGWLPCRQRGSIPGLLGRRTGSKPLGWFGAGDRIPAL